MKSGWHLHQTQPLCEKTGVWVVADTPLHTLWTDPSMLSFHSQVADQQQVLGKHNLQQIGTAPKEVAGIVAGMEIAGIEVGVDCIAGRGIGKTGIVAERMVTAHCTQRE